MIDVKEIRMLNQKGCRCGYHEFTLEDVRSVEQLADAHGFYGNLVKHYAKAICPECTKETILLLKQVGQTWEIMNTAVTKDVIIIEAPKKEVQQMTSQVTSIKNTVTKQPEIKNEEEKELNQEFICPECKKVCKNKSGLAAHMRTHQN